MAQHGRLPAEVFVEQQVLALDVVDATKFGGIADRPVHGSGRDLQRPLDVVEQFQRVAGRAVVLVDERQDRQAMPAAASRSLVRFT